MKLTSPSPSGRVRRAAHAGRFYPAQPAQLRAELEALLGAVPAVRDPAPKALIAPHAGYMYSGPIAASAYARLLPARANLHRVVLIGPSHFAAFPGIAASGRDAFATPLGLVPLDREATARATALPGVIIDDAPHEPEHCLEVHLPFLQIVLDQFQVIPLLVGEATEAEVERVLDALWGGPETCILVSSDLSHYHDYLTAQELDRNTVRAIEALRSDTLDGSDACGFEGIRGLLAVARRRNLECHAVDVRNSGDTSGSRARVVGYGAFVFSARRPPTNAADL